MIPHDADPKGLVREAFAIEGISLGECRSIFLDWALSLAPDTDPRAALTALLAHYAAQPADHPMRQTLAEGLAAAPQPKRRGGSRARMKDGPAL